MADEILCADVKVGKVIPAYNSLSHYKKVYLGLVDLEHEYKKQ